MFLNVRKLVAYWLLLLLAGQQAAVHVHNSDGSAHGGLVELFSRPEPTVHHHHCDGPVPHWHVEGVQGSTECFLCSILASNRGVPVFRSVPFVGMSDPEPTQAQHLWAPRPLRSHEMAAPRAPPAA
jgi:hypothetical protein